MATRTDLVDSLESGGMAGLTGLSSDLSDGLSDPDRTAPGKPPPSNQALPPDEAPRREVASRADATPGRDGDGARILVIEDERQIRRFLRVALTARGYQLQEATSGQEGLEQVPLFHPDLVILDLNLPDLDGIQVVRQLREWSAVPIVILSVREHEKDKIAALDAGADDYVTKPFSMGELLARIRVALRHAAHREDQPVIRLGDLEIDFAHRRVTVAGEDVKLTPTEYDILKELATHLDRVVTHKQLLRAVWGPGYQQEVHYLRVYVGQLRRKIEADPSQPRHLLTEPGVGYRLTDVAAAATDVSADE